MALSTGGSPWRQAALIVAVYAAVAGAWIALSDHLLAAVVRDAQRLTELQTVKGWGFVAVTAALLFALISTALVRRRALERETAASRERYRQLFDGLSDAAFVHALTADGGIGATLEVNRAAVERLGWPREELLRLPLATYLAPGTAALVDGLLEQLRVHGRFLVEGEHATRDGRRVPFEANGVRMEVDGRPAMLVITRDISERRRTQEELVRSERLAAVGVLASGLAHEFNNLHAAVLGEIELSLLDPAVPAPVRHRLDLAITSIERAGGLTRNLLAVGRRGGGERAPCDPRGIVRETLAILRGQLAADRVELEADLGDAPPVLADRAQIGQVVMNLVINAWHALSGRTQRRIRVAVRADAGVAVIAIEDTGCGIPPEVRERLFIPFFTTKGAHATDGSPQAAHPGTGLGLSVSRAIIEAHRGSIAIDSTVGVGSTFTVRLPAHTGVAPAGPAAPARIAPRRILVIDDETVVRDVIGDGLRLDGHEVVVTDDGEEALRLHAERPFDLALVDLQMPKLGGAPFLQRLRQAGLPPLRTIAMTGRVEGDGPPAGFDLLLVKPFPLPDLRRAVATALASSR